MQESYKVLVLDRFSRDVLTPLLHVKDLRSHGVTLHLLLDTDRQNIPDVPAVYLVKPTPANVARAVQDAAVGTYARFHLNFVTPLPRDLLESMADHAVKAGCVDRIGSVHDQMLGFIAPEVRLCLAFALLPRPAHHSAWQPRVPCLKSRHGFMLTPRCSLTPESIGTRAGFPLHSQPP